ncbi:quinoprotein dehydrogenase-associated SoxYZ-like carrier [Roseicella aquatilis]|nr:quinoprotein dehydrogenase-associated SoxYZ-like carrier [Roseicella aquatilis]
MPHRPSLPRRPVLLGAGLAATGFRPVLAQGIESAEAPRRTERWRDLREAIFGSRRAEPAGEALILTAPARALDAAAVPIAIALSAEAAPAVRAVTLVIDENPAPVAARFEAGPGGDLRTLSTRVRVDAYTFLHAVAETADGRLLETAQFIKAAGGCSAPLGGTLEAARQRLGRMRLVLPEGPPGPGRAVPVQVAVSHPNTSGMQIDQLTRLSIPAEFLRALRISYRGAEVMRIETDISIAENPTFGFALQGEPGGELRVEALDNRDRRFEAAWMLVPAG